MDVHSSSQRSFNMSQIKGKNTKPERIVRQWLWQNGYRYRPHRKALPGKPDIVFAGLRKIIFVNGCFWHKHNCNYFKWPKSNTEFWRQKIEANVRRDADNYISLNTTGWDYMVVWECEIKERNLEPLWERIKAFLNE